MSSDSPPLLPTADMVAAALDDMTRGWPDAVKQAVTLVSEQLIADGPEYTWRFSGKSVEGLRALHENRQAASHQIEAVLLTIMKSSVEAGRFSAFPDSSIARFAFSLNRILRDAARPEGLGIKKVADNLYKEVGICRASIIPGGCRVIVPQIPLYRRLAVTGGPGQFIRFLRTYATTLGKQFYALNVHAAEVEFFSEEEFYKLFLQIADLLETRPEVGGVVHGPGWLADPQLQKITPHLAYNSRFFQQHGDGVFYSRDDDENSYAFSKSASRRALYERGEYVPRLNMGVIRRPQILRWAATYRARHVAA